MKLPSVVSLGVLVLLLGLSKSSRAPRSRRTQYKSVLIAGSQPGAITATERPENFKTIFGDLNLASQETPLSGAFYSQNPVLLEEAFKAHFLSQSGKMFIAFLISGLVEFATRGTPFATPGGLYIAPESRQLGSFIFSMADLLFGWFVLLSGWNNAYWSHTGSMKRRLAMLIWYADMFPFFLLASVWPGLTESHILGPLVYFIFIMFTAVVEIIAGKVQ